MLLNTAFLAIYQPILYFHQKTSLYLRQQQIFSTHRMYNTCIPPVRVPSLTDGIQDITGRFLRIAWQQRSEEIDVSDTSRLKHLPHLKISLRSTDSIITYDYSSERGSWSVWDSGHWLLTSHLGISKEQSYSEIWDSSCKERCLLLIMVEADKVDKGKNSWHYISSLKL